MENKCIIKQPIQGSRTLSNYLISSILFLAGLSFFSVGLSSYLHIEFFPFTDTDDIIFLPQGILLIFYGTLGILLGSYFFLNILLDVGSGYNEFSKKDDIIRIVRKGLPGKNSLVFLTYSLNSVKKLRILIKQGLNPRNNIYLILRDKREIPLYPSQNYININQIEKIAIELSDFLSVPLETDSEFFNF